MTEDFKLDINIPQKNIEQMAKQVVRELIEGKINEIMIKINVEKLVEEKVKSIIESKTTKIIDTSTKEIVSDIRWSIEDRVKKEIHDIVIKEVQKKPLSGNVYLKIGNDNVETDWD
jgi:16S rRNA C1402 N4-methylase RsmH